MTNKFKFRIRYNFYYRFCTRQIEASTSPPPPPLAYLGHLTAHGAQGGGISTLPLKGGEFEPDLSFVLACLCARVHRLSVRLCVAADEIAFIQLFQLMLSYESLSLPQGNMGFLCLSSAKSAVPFLPCNSKAYGRVFMREK